MKGSFDICMKIESVFMYFKNYGLICGLQRNRKFYMSFLMPKRTCVEKSILKSTVHVKKYMKGASEMKSQPNDLWIIIGKLD